MRRPRFTAQQITAVLRQAEARAAVTERCRQLQITEITFDRWHRRCGDLGNREARLLRGENRKLKDLVVELTLGKLIRQEPLG